MRVFAGDVAELAVAEAQAARDIVAADPGLLRRRGILTVTRLTDLPSVTLGAADGLAHPFGRDLRFRVRYEHLPIPAAGEGVIGAVPADLSTATFSGRGRLIYVSDFTEDPLGDFTPLDSPPGTGTAGAWTYDAAADEVVQTGTRASGGNGLAGTKTGSYLILNPGAGGEVLNFVAHAEMRNGASGGIGLVFRFRDIANFGFVQLERPADVRVMGTRVADTGNLLASGGQDATSSYPQDEWIRLRLLADADRFELAINEVTVLAGRDPGLTEPGSVGLFCRRAGGARLRNFRLSSL